MALEFTEDLTIEMPRAEGLVQSLQESDYRKNHGIIAEVAAIHAGLTKNFNNYPKESLEESLSSWVKPYPRPILMNHDPYSEPIGRVMAAKMDTESDGIPYVGLQIAITDPNSVAKVLDGRYLTGSVGGSATEARCSICSVDWAAESNKPYEAPCKHARGKTYKGQLAYFNLSGIDWKEYSIVNMPGDSRSGVKSILTTSEGEQKEADEWIHSARFFSLDMNNKSIVELNEAEGSKNVLEGMKSKEATPVYMNLKGAFISAIAMAEAQEAEGEGGYSDADKESNVETDLINEEEEDLLEVTQTLTADLNSAPEAEQENTEEEEQSVEEEEVSEDGTTTEEKETSESEESSEGGESPEGQEKGQDQLPVSRESDDEGDAEEVTEEEESENTLEAEAEAEESQEEEVTTELEESVKTLESRVEELDSQKQTLLEENARLKAALKHGLAERVVDMKIAMGITTVEQREEQVSAHVQRSASSLADSIRDLASMPIPTVSQSEADIEIPKVQEKSAAVLDDAESEITETEEVQEEERKTEINAEEGLFRLMNRSWAS